MKDIYCIIFTKEKGKEEFTFDECVNLSRSQITFHREDGPAYEEPFGYKAWWINDNRHREDGPDRIYLSGKEEWWMNNVQLTKLDKEYLIKYMEHKGLTVAHLLLDPDLMIRNSANEINWREVI